MYKERSLVQLSDSKATSKNKLILALNESCESIHQRNELQAERQFVNLIPNSETISLSEHYLTKKKKNIGSSSSLKYMHKICVELMIRFCVTFVIIISVLSGEKLKSFLIKCLLFCIFAVNLNLLKPQVRVFISREVLLVEEPLK